MNLKKEIAAGAATLLLIGSAMNVSAAELSSSDYANTLIKNNQESLIIDVEAYKAAYADLAQAFGDDSDAYVNHYLTIGVYEGRTKGILFDPLVYAEAYGDVKAAYGYDISAIVNHYVNFGIKENRTQGTANGYTDIAAAEEAGVQNTKIQRDSESINAYNSNAVNSAGSNSAGNSNPGNDSSPADSVGSESSSPADSMTSAGNNTPAVSNTPAGNSSSNAPAAASAPVSTSDNNPGYSFDYDRTTTIYKNDGTLWRVEYYDENNKLTHYSDITNYDGSTNSYTENIYHYDNETNTQILDRTDIYENGSLTSSGQ